ncbi:MAG TPA: hypothetical protein VJ063_10405 [Verrucomicrobiae bacterium]|nr:hypothetical protein [Verrucomicrobiae bacterium]
MDIVIQHTENKLYLGHDAAWLKSHARAATFTDAVKAIEFCIQHHLRRVRLVWNSGSHEEKFVYPFGGDPVVKAEQKKIRRLVAESRRLKHQRLVILQHIDSLTAEAKERRKQRPFKKSHVVGD